MGHGDRTGWIRVEIPWDAERDALADDRARGQVGMSCLGRHGHWGNCVLQYAFLRAFAAESGLEPRTPAWLGDRLLQVDDERMTSRPDAIVIDRASRFSRLDRFHEFLGRGNRAVSLIQDGRRVFALDAPTSGVLPDDADNLDLEGLFFVHTRHLAAHRESLRRLLRPAPTLDAACAGALQRLRAKGRTVVGVHMREFRWRCGYHGFDYDAPIRWYRDWLDGALPGLDQPVVFVCGPDAEAAKPHFARYGAFTTRDLGAELPRELAEPELPAAHVQKDARFFPDWYLLSHCDLIAASNSTFSFTAAMMSERGRAFVRPVVGGPGLVGFDPWNSEPLDFLPPQRLLVSEILLRAKLAHRAHGLRFGARNLRLYGSWYPLLLAFRSWACLKLAGRRKLIRELLNPAFYLASQRRFGFEYDDGDPGDGLRELHLPPLGRCIGDSRMTADGARQFRARSPS